MFSYTVKVRGKVYLWGSGTLLKELSVPLLLVIRNDLLGDPVELAGENLGEAAPLGTLGPGECWTVPLLGLRGLSASCVADSLVSCSILAPHLGEP